jgi:hypothetical protein
MPSRSRRSLYYDGPERRVFVAGQAGLVVRPDRSPQHHRVEFSVTLNGWGDIGLLSYNVQHDEYARIDFKCLIPGMLVIRINGKVIVNAEAEHGTAHVSGLFFPGGSRVDVHFSSFGSGSINGSIAITPAPNVEALYQARKMFGLGQVYTHEELKKAYQTLVMRWHPDRAGGDGNKLREINYLHGVLKAHLGPT